MTQNEAGKVIKRTKKLSPEDNSFGLRISCKGNIFKPNKEIINNCSNGYITVKEKVNQLAKKRKLVINLNKRT